MNAKTNGQQGEQVSTYSHCIVDCGWLDLEDHGDDCERTVGRNANAVTEPGWAETQIWCSVISSYIRGTVPQSFLRDCNRYRNGIQATIQARGDITIDSESQAGWSKVRLNFTSAEGQAVGRSVDCRRGQPRPHQQGRLHDAARGENREARRRRHIWHLVTAPLGLPPPDLIGTKHRSGYGAGEYGATDETGMPYHPNLLTFRWRKLLDNLGIKRVRLHDARHSCATLMHLRGVPIAVIAAWLGHSSAAFTMSVYAHSQDVALKAAASSFSRVVTARDTQTAADGLRASGK